MRKLWVLLKLNFRAMLRAFSFRSGAGSSKKKAAGGLGALLLMAFLALYLSGVYSFCWPPCWRRWASWRWCCL